MSLLLNATGDRCPKVPCRRMLWNRCMQSASSHRNCSRVLNRLPETNSVLISLKVDSATALSQGQPFMRRER